MDNKIIISILLFLVFINGISQEDEGSSYRTMPFQVTLVTPLGTNGIQSFRITNRLSFNIVAGTNGGVDGFELGSVLNIISSDVSGVQLSGFGNVVGGPVHAVQVAGFMNINRDEFEGVQASGFINYVYGYSRAIQVAGFANLSGELKGLQGSGFANFTGDAEGLQAAGFMNCADNIKGIQGAGFLNAAEDVRGIQLAGFLNAANKVKGLQIAGFLNICDTIDGIPVAPISIVRKGGYMKFEYWGNETFYMNASLKTGVKKFYTIFSFGYKGIDSDFNTGAGFGAGTNISITQNNSIDIDVNAYYINKYFWRNRDYNQLNTLRVSFNHEIAEHFSIFAGPAFNVLISEFRDSADEIAPSWAFNISDRRNSLRGWFGFNLGFKF